jgi:hypothetical protein
MYLHKDLYTAVPGSFVCKSQEPETTHTLINRKVKKQIVVYPRGRILHIHKIKWANANTSM